MMELTKPFAVAIMTVVVHAAKLTPIEGSLPQITKLTEQTGTQSKGRRLIPESNDAPIFAGAPFDIEFNEPPSPEDREAFLEYCKTTMPILSG